MSAFGGKADMTRTCLDVRLWSFGLIALIFQRKCFTSQLRIDPYSPVSSCALVKQYFRIGRIALGSATMPVRTADIAEQIIARRRIYEAAYQADLTRLRARHGDRPVADALVLIEQQAPLPCDWDARGHAHRVVRGIERAVAEHREHQEIDEPLAARAPE